MGHRLVQPSTVLAVCNSTSFSFSPRWIWPAGKAAKALQLPCVDVQLRCGVGMHQGVGKLHTCKLDMHVVHETHSHYRTTKYMHITVCMCIHAYVQPRLLTLRPSSPAPHIELQARGPALDRQTVDRAIPCRCRVSTSETTAPSGWRAGKTGKQGLVRYRASKTAWQLG